MKKIMLAFVFLFVSLMLTSCKKNKLEQIKIAEVTHSVFYAPQYVAISQGFFKEVGIEVELINAGGADKVMAALLSGDVDVGFSGPEATIYVYNKCDLGISPELPSYIANNEDPNRVICAISAKNGEGIDTLLEKIEEIRAKEEA